MDPTLRFKDIASYTQPLLFKNHLKWDLIQWKIEQWRALFSPETRAVFRQGPKKCSQNPIWERNCTDVTMKMNEFFDIFSASTVNSDDPWLYFDYKHISKHILESSIEKLNFTWEDVGFPDVSAKDSTLWIGTPGAHTPCHKDTYGCNFVAQIFGRKRWLLFPPSETANLKPTRVPYEESSVYSSYNFYRGCAKYPDVKEAIMVDLDPGDVLFVPKSWWHYVENLTSAISVNVWIPRESDNESRLEECLVKYVVCSTIANMSDDETKELLNPNEGDLLETPPEQVIEQLKWCLDAMNSSTSSPATKNELEPLKNYVLLPKTSIEEIKLKQRVPHECNIDSDTDNANTVHLNLIKALCHPDVVDLVVNKFLQLNHDTHQ